MAGKRGSILPTDFQLATKIEVAQNAIFGDGPSLAQGGWPKTRRLPKTVRALPKQGRGGGAGVVGLGLDHPGLQPRVARRVAWPLLGFVYRV